jgi:protein-tyrosine phosphatase
VIDLHTHVLPGIDDGPPTMEGSLELAAAALADGTDVLCATPHVMVEMPQNTAPFIAERVAEAQRALDDAGIGVRIVRGGEVALTRAVELTDEELHALHLAGGEWMLAECPLSPAAAGFETILFALQARGHRILLAHPERSPALQRRPQLVASLVEAGMLTSITAGALRGDFGRTARDFAFQLLEDDLVHNIASDTHDAHRRRPQVQDAIAAADAELPGVAERAAWMTLDVPKAILGGGEIPPAPSDPPRRRRRSLFRRASRSR